MKSLPVGLTLRALRTQQGGISVFSLFVRGSDLLRVADISRLERGPDHELLGFQRGVGPEHVNDIAHYLDNGGTLFPNAIILALSPETRFVKSRGPADGDLTSSDTEAGKLHIPIRPEGQRVAWIVDGQQRSLALGKSAGAQLMVPVVAFETASIEVRREQFILVNRAKPLSRRLIDELLPETHGTLLPRDLNSRQLPSVLCNALNTHENSPLRGMLKRTSDTPSGEPIVRDSAILNMIRRSLSNPNGALAMFKPLDGAPSDTSAMLTLLVDFWSAVRETFPEAWGKPPADSRLMHSVGVAALGDLMDRIVAGASSQRPSRTFFVRELARIAPDCAWTHGRWATVDKAWDEFENTPRDVKLLAQVVVQIYSRRSRS